MVSWVRPYLEGIDSEAVAQRLNEISSTSGVGIPSQLALCVPASEIWHVDTRATYPRRCASCPCMEGGDGRRRVVELTCWAPLTAHPRSGPEATRREPDSPESRPRRCSSSSPRRLSVPRPCPHRIARALC